MSNNRVLEQIGLPLGDTRDKRENALDRTGLRPAQRNEPYLIPVLRETSDAVERSRQGAHNLAVADRSNEMPMFTADETCGREPDCLLVPERFSLKPSFGCLLGCYP